MKSTHGISRFIPLLALSLGFFMVIIDANIVNVALPSIAKDLKIGIDGLQWVIDGYTLTFACLLLSAGNWGDKFGARPTFLYGLGIFALTSLGCALASKLIWLVTFRLLQGMAAALIVPTSLALIHTAYQTKADRANAIGIWGGIGGIAGITGPVLGAVLTAWLGWRAVFFVNVPIGLFAIILTLKLIPHDIKTNKDRFDISGQLLAIVSLAALAFSLIEAGKNGWLSTPVISGILVAVSGAVGFLIVETRTPEPLFPLQFFKVSAFSNAMIIGVILNSSTYGLLFILPLYFQEIRGYSVLITGFAIMPMLALGAVGSYLGGKLTSIIGPWQPMALGLGIGAIGFFTLLMIKELTPSYFILMPALAAIGLGATLTMPAATSSLINSVPENRAGFASGAFNASRQTGSLVGVAIFGTIVHNSKQFVSGMHICLAIAGLAFLLGCIAACYHCDAIRLKFKNDKLGQSNNG